MSKYHVNNQGEPGKCRAEGDGCPFGSADKHHDSPEIARAAYEKSNVGRELPAPVKKVSRRERKEQVAAMNEAYNNHDASKYDGLRFSEVTFDHVANEQQNRSYVKRSFPKLSKPDVEAAVNMRMESDRAKWERAARTEPAEAFEKDVPIRLVPVGAEVVSDDGTVIGIVDKPSPRHDVADFVGIVRMNDGTERSFEGNQGINIGKLPAEEVFSTDSMWDRNNSHAKKISENRVKYQKAVRTGRALDNLERMM